MKKQFIIREAPNPSRQNAILAVQAAEVGMVVEIKPQVKRRIQEEKYHAMLGDISKQFKFCDRLWDQEDMKRILVDAFKKDTITEYFDLWKQVGDIEFAPALDGRGVVVLGAQTRKFPVKLASLFIEWLYAFGAENNIQWSGYD